MDKKAAEQILESQDIVTIVLLIALLISAWQELGLEEVLILLLLAKYGIEYVLKKIYLK